VVETNSPARVCCELDVLFAIPATAQTNDGHRPQV
jgi:hypothetical protein